MKLLVLAAGYATRLRPLTDHRPKPLLPVRGRPMIDHVLERFTDTDDIDEVLVVTNSRFAAQFQSWAKDAGTRYKSWRLRIIDDGTTSNDDRLGAIGDISFVVNRTRLDDDLLVVAGDNLFSHSLADFVATARRRGVLVGIHDVGDLEAIKSYSSVSLSDDARIDFFAEKPAAPKTTLAAIALYHYPRRVLPLIAQYLAEGNSPDQPGRLVEWLYSRIPCYGYRILGSWWDIGSKESYEAVQSAL